MRRLLDSMLSKESKTRLYFEAKDALIKLQSISTNPTEETYMSFGLEWLDDFMNPEDERLQSPGFVQLIEMTENDESYGEQLDRELAEILQLVYKYHNSIRFTMKMRLLV